MRISRGMGVPAIGLGIIKQRGANTVEVAQGVRKKIAEVEKSLPPGMSMAVNFDSSEFVEQSVHELKRTLLLSAILTSLVCWMFLGSWSSTLNVLLAIPTSVVGSFIFLYFSGFTLNIFTLLGLSLSIGIVVDDAIMVLENIIRHQEMGEGRVSGAINGAREITFAAVAATAAIVAIFLPVVFMKGIIGQFFFQFGVTLTVAVLLSLVEALTLTPMRCSQFVTVGERRTRIGRAMENTIEATRRFYRWSLERALHHRIIVTTVSLAIFALSLLTIPAINKELIPPEDQSRLLVRLQTPVGSSISYTNEKFKEAEKFLAAQPEVLRYYAAVGGGGAGGQVNSGIIFITMKDRGQRGINPKAGHELSQQEFMAVCRNAFNKIPDVKAAVQDLSMRGFSSSRGFPVELTIQGPEWDQLGQYAQKIMQAMDKSGMVTDVDTDYQVGMPEIHIIPDREKAAAHGVSVTTIGDTVNAMIGGVVAGSYPKNGHRYDIRVKLEENTADKMNEIKKLYVRNNRGELIPLSEVVRVEQKPTLQVISRMNRARAITIFSNIKPGESQQKVLKAVNQMAQQILPPGYFVTPSGSAQGFSESFRSLMIALILGIFVSYMVLASQFNSFMHPITVLMALPFSISGALVALLLTGQSLNLYSMIGLILLLGIVKKNSILLVDFTNQIRDRGNISITDALLEACPIRLRPILMTSIATIAGALPAALALGAGSESRKPMAIAIIGGVLVSTLLTLYVVPVVYSLLAKENRHRIEAVESKEQKTRLAKSR